MNSRNSFSGRKRRRPSIGFLAGLFYVLTPAVKPLLRGTIGRSPRMWSALKRARDRLVRGAPPPTGMEAPLGERARATLGSWFGGESRSRGAMTPARPFGVNVAGFLTSEKGTGEAARSAASVLRAAGVPVVLNAVRDSSSNNVERVDGVSRDNPYAINLVYVNADQAANFAWHKGEGYFRGRYNIGVWNWEVLGFPEEWIPRFGYFNEIWAGSTFAAEALASVSPVPVTCVPYAINPSPEVAEGLGRSRFGIGRDCCFYLFMFDFHSVMERKNPLGLIEAFKRAFSPDDSAALLIKSSRADDAAIKAMEEAARGHNIQIVDAVISREEVNALYCLCDCYVSLHRSEGFGLTVAEAMAAGKPVIATGFSGNMDFMTPENSLPVRYNLTEIERDYLPYRKGWTWAEPDTGHAAELMRWVYESPEEAAALGKKARNDVLEKLHPDTIGQVMKRRLMQIAADMNIAIAAEQPVAGRD